MRGLTWLVGVLVILLGFGQVRANPSGWAAVWITAAVLWFFVGCVLGVMSLAKLVSTKMPGRGAGGVRAGLRHPPSVQSSGTADE